MKPIKLVCISDLHGNLPNNIPECDILLVGGDICPVYNHKPKYQFSWINVVFDRWIRTLPAKEKFVVAGNHDFVFEAFPEIVQATRGQWDFIYLQDELSISKTGLKIWGSPWQKPFCNWAFNMEEESLAHKWALIPADTDIYLLHSPPWGHGDAVWRRKDEEKWPVVEHVGSESLTENILTNQPSVVVYGHIHHGYGRYSIGNSIALNSSYVNEQYKPQNKPWEIELNGDGK